MSTGDRLTPFSYALLVLVGRDGAGAHDLRRMMERGRVYWSGAASQYYAEAKRLAERGFLEAHRQPGRTRERTLYTLTDKGYEALAAWVRTPAPFPRMQSEPLVRLLAADLVDPEAVLDGLRGLRAEIEELTAGIAEGERVAAALPHRAHLLLLNHRLARRLLEAHSEWLDDVERELGDR